MSTDPFDALRKEASQYLPTDKLKGLHSAYLFADKAHAGQLRASGRAYIEHPLAVAQILTEMRLDYSSVTAAILHDVIEDTIITKSRIEDQFSSEIATLVDGVTKLEKVKFQDATEHQAENFRKMVMAMVGDIRVILIKLADRLHNMRTLKALRRDKQRRIAIETLEVYAPIADRLGLRKMCLALENLGFEALYPYRYCVLDASIKSVIAEQASTVTKIRKVFEEQLQKDAITAKIEHGTRYPYRIYRQISPSRHARNLLVLMEFHICVRLVSDCYRVLGTVHQLYRPLFKYFKDYIALPKENGYQSLHTRLICPHGSIAVTIRTEYMNAVSEHGVAVRWLHNDDPDKGLEQAMEWLRGLHDLHQEADNSIEFSEHIKIDLFPREVYVFTPDGSIKALPQNATVIDFAYAIHTAVGNHCIGAKVDQKDMPLNTVLQTGQTIEVISSPQSRPRKIWLNFVMTAKARSEIRSYLKKLRDKEAIEVGEQLLKQALAHRHITLDAIPSERFKELTKQLSLDNREALLRGIGLNSHSAAVVAERLTTNLVGVPQTTKPPPTPVLIQEADGQVIQLCRCCYPVPGDPISGVLNPKLGITVHNAACQKLAMMRSSATVCVEVVWGETDTAATFMVALRIYVGNTKGTLAAVSKAIADQGVNISTAKVYSEDGINSGLDFVVEVSGREQLEKVMRRVMRSNLVSDVKRVHTGTSNNLVSRGTPHNHNP